MRAAPASSSCTAGRSAALADPPDGGTRPGPARTPRRGRRRRRAPCSRFAPAAAARAAVARRAPRGRRAVRAGAPLRRAGCRPAERAELLERRSAACYLTDQNDEAIEAHRGGARVPPAARRRGSRRATRFAGCRRSSGARAGPPRPSGRPARRSRCSERFRRARAGDGVRQPRARPARPRHGAEEALEWGEPGARAGRAPRRHRDRGVRAGDDRRLSSPTGSRAGRSSSGASSSRSAPGSTSRSGATLRRCSRGGASGPRDDALASALPARRARLLQRSRPGAGPALPARSTAHAWSSTRAAGTRQPTPPRPSCASPAPRSRRASSRWSCSGSSVRVAATRGSGRRSTRRWALAEPTRELPRLGPVAAARAEAAWLDGDRDAVAEATEARSQLASTRQVGLADRRAGPLAPARRHRRAEVPAGAAEPYASQLAGDWARAAELWRELGCPYEAALALADADEEDAAAAGARRAPAARARGRRRRSSPADCASAACAVCRGARGRPRGRTRPG